jgi:PAP2 superfamily
MFDQSRPGRRTVIGHVHGVPFSGKRKDAFPSGHALHMGALASAAGTLPTGPRLAIRALAVGLSLTRIVVLAHWASDVVAGFALGAVLELSGFGPVTRATLRRAIMPTFEDLKGYAQRATGLGRPGKLRAMDLVRARKPHRVRFKDDGLIPNHPRWPLIICRKAVALDDRQDPAAVIEDLFEANGWKNTWRDGIYDYVHYHSKIHEVLGIARGKGRVRFGAKRGGSSR